MADLTVLVAARDEEACIGRTVSELRRLFPDAWIVVADDGSRDATADVAEAAGAEVVRGLVDEDYGSRGFTVRDQEGNLWSFGTYAGE